MIEGLRGTHVGPLGKAAKLVLMLSATATILVCYLFSLLSILGLLLTVATEFVLMIALARFGLGGVMMSAIQRHIMLIGLFGRNLWLTKSAEYRIPLGRSDAPDLFAMLDTLASRMRIRAPREVLIEMNCGAWVRLRGYRRGAGKTTLGIGYDLLAALNMSEFEAVMAHEMTHAKLVERGLKSWLNGGLARIARVANAFTQCVAAYREQRQNFPTAKFFRDCSDAMTRLAARLVSAYSRQDEFEADRGAAEFCGTVHLRTSLMRLNVINPRLARLPWAERVSRIEVESSFGAWLVDELKVPAVEALAASTVEARDPYSTHPSLHDRLAALPEIEGRAENPAPAMDLLLRPDRVAAELIEEIHRIVAEQEQKDSLQLAKAARKVRSATVFTWSRLPGLGLIVLAVVAGFAFLVNGLDEWRLPVAAAPLLAGGIWAMRLGRYRDRYELPVPRFADLKKAWEAPFPDDLKAREAAYEAEFKARGWAAMKKQFGFENLIKEAFASLGRCEYLRAHVATRLAIDMDNKSVDAALGHAIASAALRMETHAGNLLVFVRSTAGISSPQTMWGAAWALTLLGDWNNAEAFLWKKHQQVPGEPTFLLLLAFVQKQRNKLQSAILDAEKAVALAPDEPGALKLLGECLLDAGRVRSAAERLDPLEESARADPELAMLMVRLRLMQLNLASAQEWADHLRAASAESKWSVRLGEAFESGRHDHLATACYEEALRAAFYPEAHVGLAKIAASRKDKAASRRHLRSALDVAKKLPDGALGPIQLFQPILNHLMQLNDVREGCRAWIVYFPNIPTTTVPMVLRGHRIMVFAQTREAASGYVHELVAAMEPGAAPTPAATVSWLEASKDQQPVRPVHPGVQCVMGKN